MTAIRVAVIVLAALLVSSIVLPVSAQENTNLLTTTDGVSLRHPAAWQSSIYDGNINLAFQDYQLSMYYGWGWNRAPLIANSPDSPIMMLGQTVYPQLMFNSVDAQNAGTPTGVEYFVQADDFTFQAMLMRLGSDQTIGLDIRQQVQRVLESLTVNGMGSNNSNNPVPVQNDYRIEYFRTDQPHIPAGGCVSLAYWAVGAQQMTLYGSNWPGGPEIITDNPNTRQVCPSAAGNYVPGQPVTYTLNVTYLNGTTESRSITITVGDVVSNDYRIEYFLADRTRIPWGGCVSLAYWVVGAPQITLYGSNWPGEAEIVTDNPNTQQFCFSVPEIAIPTQTVTYTLKATYPNGTTEGRDVTITVGDVVSNDYRIEYFHADQTHIPAGGCITLAYWAVGAQQMTLYGSNWLGEPEIITDNPNTRQICPSAAANYVPDRPVVYTLNVTYLNGITESRNIIIETLPLSE